MGIGSNFLIGTSFIYIGPFSLEVFDSAVVNVGEVHAGVAEQ